MFPSLRRVNCANFGPGDLFECLPVPNDALNENNQRDPIQRTM